MRLEFSRILRNSYLPNRGRYRLGNFSKFSHETRENQGGSPPIIPADYALELCVLPNLANLFRIFLED